MTPNTKIKGVALGNILFAVTGLLVHTTAKEIPVTLTYEIINTTELSNEFSGSIDTASFRDGYGEWQSIRKLNEDRNSITGEINIDTVEKIQLSMTDVSVGTGRLKTAAVLPLEKIEIPSDLNLKPYQEIEINIEIYISEGLQESGRGMYLYNPHVLLEMNGKRTNQEQSELLLKTEIHQNKEGVVMYGPPENKNADDDTSAEVEVIQEQ